MGAVRQLLMYLGRSVYLPMQARATWMAVYTSCSEPGVHSHDLPFAVPLPPLTPRLLAAQGARMPAPKPASGRAAATYPCMINRT